MPLQNAFDDLALDSTIVGVTINPDDIYTGSPTTTGAVTVVAAPGAGQRLVIRLLHATPDSNNTNFPQITFRETAGRDIFRGFAVQWRQIRVPLAENTAFELDLNKNGTVSYTAWVTQEPI